MNVVTGVHVIMPAVANESETTNRLDEWCQDRRDSHRVRLRVPASIRISGGPWCDAGLARDVSASGARLELPRELAAEYETGDPVAIELRMPAADGTWPTAWTTGGDAVVVRVEEDHEAGGNDSMNVAARFVDQIRFRF